MTAQPALSIKLDAPSRRAAFLDRVAVSIHVAVWYVGFVFLALAPIVAYFVPFVRLPLLLYIGYIWGPGARAGFQANGPGFLYRIPLWDRYVDYFGAQLHKTAPIPGDRPYIFCVHPHGIYNFSGILAFCTSALGFDRLFPGVKVNFLGASGNFKIPLLREYLIGLGMGDVSKAGCLKALTAGRSIGIAIGGREEGLLAAPGKADITLEKRKGFVAIALTTGAALVPVYAFGENDLYDTAYGFPKGHVLRRLQRLLAPIDLPVMLGAGLFFSRGFLPKQRPLNVVVGEPIILPKFTGSTKTQVFRDMVDKYHNIYTESLTRLHAAHADRFAPGGDELRVVM